MFLGVVAIRFPIGAPSKAFFVRFDAIHGSYVADNAGVAFSPRELSCEAACCAGVDSVSAWNRIRFASWDRPWANVAADDRRDGRRRR